MLASINGNIVQLDDPVLRQRSVECDVTDWDIAHLSSVMMQSMIANDGIGLAAVQIGVPKRIFVYRDHDATFAAFTVINPVIVNSGALFGHTEGCLSIPNALYTVQRWTTTRLQGQDLDGRAIDRTADGLEACIFQHEMDHLAGKLICDSAHEVRTR